MKQDSARLIGTTVPSVRTWAVYLDFSMDNFYAEPVLYFTVWEVTDGENRFLESYPVPFDQDSLDEERGDTVGYLGLSLTAGVSREDWADEIKAAKARYASLTGSRRSK